SRLKGHGHQPVSGEHLGMAWARAGGCGSVPSCWPGLSSFLLLRLSSSTSSARLSQSALKSVLESLRSSPSTSKLMGGASQANPPTCQDMATTLRNCRPARTKVARRYQVGSRLIARLLSSTGWRHEHEKPDRSRVPLVQRWRHTIKAQVNWSLARGASRVARQSGHSRGITDKMC